MPSGAENPTGPGSLRARLAAAGVDLPPDAAELERALTLHAARLRDLEAAADLGPDDPPFPAQPGWARPGWVQPGRTSDPPIAGAPGSPEPSDPGRPRPGVRWGRGRSGGGPAGQAVPGLVDAAALVRDGELTSVALVERVLGRIEAEDGRLGAFVAVLASRALDEAAVLDAERARGRLRGPLHGVPVAVKDLLDVAGTVTGAGSPKLAANLAAADAEAVARLRRAGAVVVGKTRTHEFAYGVRTPGTVNPWDPERIAGGSSGGSAAAVAAGLVPAAVGSDTAGSIRIPAACCGVVGLKPTYGAVPVTGVWPLAWSCDTVGPIAGSVADAALAFAVLAGRALPAPKPEPGPEPAGLRLGWLVGEEVEAIDPGVASVMGELRARLAAAGVVVDEVRLPLRAARAAVGAIVLPELAAAHARLLAETGEEGYGPPVLAAIRLGQAALAGEYLAGLRYRGRFAALVEQALAGRDALVLPTVPVPAPRHHDSTVLLGGVPVGVQAALTALPGSFNCSGSPVLSLPAGVSGGLPVGISLVGRAGGDGQLLRFAAALEPVLPAPGRPPTSA
jgi:aspartyl-tRNA(Asn)/glutamyl-tRNA(Gln) amidotransferase subunit A